MIAFIDKYGLLIVTTFLFLITCLYTLATIKMANVGLREHKLRAQPQISFQPIIVLADGWNSICFEQEIINVGLSYVRIESAILHWWPYLTKDQQKAMRSNLILPAYLAPGERLKVKFEVKNGMITHLPQGSLASLEELLTGHLIYKYKGLNETVIETVESLP